MPNLPPLIIFYAVELVNLILKASKGRSTIETIALADKADVKVASESFLIIFPLNFSLNF